MFHFLLKIDINFNSITAKHIFNYCPTRRTVVNHISYLTIAMTATDGHRWSRMAVSRVLTFHSSGN